MTEPIALVPSEPNDELIERLEELLAMAKTGYMQSIIYAGSTDKCEVLSGWLGTTSVMATLGELECVKLDFIAKNVEMRATTFNE